MPYFLFKTEPEEYSFNDLLRDKTVVWDGVRNYQARNNLKLMKKGDKVLIYHSGEKKEIVGIAEVTKEHYPDPVDKIGIWVVVELKPVKKLARPFTLEEVKREKILSNMPLLKQSRLSVMPLSKKEFDFIVSFSYDRNTD